MTKKTFYLALLSLLLGAAGIHAQVRQTVAILGDSYSTFEGYIYPDTNESWAGAQMGEYKYGDWKRADLYFFRPAMAKLLDDAQKRYPNARLLFLLNSELRDEVNSSVRTICKDYGVSLLELKDVDKLAGHPTVKGMESISRQVLKALQQ